MRETDPTLPRYGTGRSPSLDPDFLCKADLKGGIKSDHFVLN